MPRIPGTTDDQSAFLRALLTNPQGPPPDAWPSPAILRRWLRRPTFRRALRNVRSALRAQSDLLLTYAATAAAQQLLAAPSVPSAPNSSEPDPRLEFSRRKSLLDLLRLSHLRQRFEPQEPFPDPEKYTSEEVTQLRKVHRYNTVAEALRRLDRRREAFIQDAIDKRQQQENQSRDPLCT